MNWRARTERHLTQAWLHRGVTAWLLRPLAFVYQALDSLRRLAYAHGWLASHRVGAKVVVVGNVIAGGAGKTPTVIAISQELGRRGFHVGIVSRGYGSQGADIRAVEPGSDVREVGDEPLLLRRRLGLPLVVGRDRVAAAQYLLSLYPEVDTVVCDDGLQHLRLYRDVEVYVFDNRGVGNGWPLPAGPLRSPWPACWIHRAGEHADKALVVHTGSRPAFEGYKATRGLTPFGVDGKGHRHTFDALIRSADRCIAVAGIAQPQAFFDMLALGGLQPARCVAMPDHFDFSDWAPPGGSDVIIVCTEKDATKLWLRYPDAIAIGLEQHLDDGFFQALHARLDLQGAPAASV